MQSDALALATTTLSSARTDFRVAAWTALEEADALLISDAADEPLTERCRLELGPFAASRIDADRFAAVCTLQRTIDGAERRQLANACALLRVVLQCDDDAFVVHVPSGASLVSCIGARLAEFGRAFAAIRTIAHVRAGLPAPFDEVIGKLPFEQWTKSERRYAPPLAVVVEGSDLHVGALADFADGHQQIFLVVKGAAPPAPLVRLITPGALVVQTEDDWGLDLLAGADAPAVVALMAHGARFIHDPRAGAELCQRLKVAFIPEPPFATVRGLSAWQMQEDVRQLVAFSKPAAPADAAAVGRAVPADGATVDRLASWLLAQAKLDDTA